MPELRRFSRAAAAGSLVAVVADLLLLSAGTLDLFPDPGPLGGFYDAQGRAILDGRLAVDPSAAGFEGFVVNGSTYIYFGPVLSLLRLPVLLATDGLDGRLTVLSMAIGFAFLLAAAAWLHWQVRNVLRPGDEIDRTDTVAVFLMQVGVGAGAVPLFLAGRAVVYHETELWGAALAVASLAAIVMVLRRASLARIALAGLLVTLAINTRVPAGLGGVLALLALAALATIGLALRDQRRLTTAAALAAAALVALGSSAVVNVAKFGEPFGIPLDKQVFSDLEPSRQAALAANGGSLFGVRYLPTTMLQSVRPDAVGTTRSFPYLGLPRDPPVVVGNARFDTLERSLSAVTSMPLLCLLALVGLVAAALRGPPRLLIAVALASAAGAGVSLTIAYVTTRYLADFLPFLLLSALVGLQMLLPAVGRGRHRTALLAGGVVLVLAGVAVNGSVGLVTQRLLSAEAEQAKRAAFVETQDEIDDLLGRTPRGVASGSALPEPGPPGDLFVLGDCDGLYVATQSEWAPVERTARSGVRDLTVRFPAGRLERPEALATVGAGRDRATVVAGPGNAITLRTRAGTVGRGTRPNVPPGRPVDLRLAFDPVISGTYYLSVTLDGRRVVEAPAPYDRLARLRAGVPDGADRGVRRFSGLVRPVASPRPALCRRLERRRRG